MSGLSARHGSFRGAFVDINGLVDLDSPRGSRSGSRSSSFARTFSKSESPVPKSWTKIDKDSANNDNDTPTRIQATPAIVVSFLLSKMIRLNWEREVDISYQMKENKSVILACHTLLKDCFCSHLLMRPMKVSWVSLLILSRWRSGSRMRGTRTCCSGGGYDCYGQSNFLRNHEVRK